MNGALRVLLVANTLPPRDVSGVGEQVLQLATGLRQRGATVEVLGRGPQGAAGPKLLFPLFAVPATLRALRRLRPHVVQVHESDGALAALAVILVRDLLHPRPLLVANFQVSYVEEWRSVRPLIARRPDGGAGEILGRPGWTERRFRWLKAPLQIVLGWLTAALADRVMACSAATAAEVARDYRRSGVEVLLNVMGERSPAGGAASPEPEEVAEGRGEAGCERTDGTLLFVGRLRIRKGVEVLLAAFAELRRQLPAARLAIAGDGEHRAALEWTARRLGLDPAELFLGRRSAAEVRCLLGSAAALVVPSIYEGLPLVVLEAMEEGVPVVASRVSGIPEVVRDGESGWLVEMEDPPALAAALRAVLGDPREAQRRGAAGRRRLEERHRPAVAAESWSTMLRRDLSGASGRQEQEEEPRWIA
jgi:glycosyltransferase involved in cell wall biosynthesis